MSNSMQESASAQAPFGAALTDVMIDIETLGTKPGAAILSIGAVMFGASGLGKTFYAPVSLTSCTDAGLTVDAETVQWWMFQSEAARAAAFAPGAEPLASALLRFAAWFHDQGGVHPWSHGATFDVPLLDAAFSACHLSAPWAFWNVRDTRTLYDQAGVKVDRSHGTQHNALDDAIAQAKTAVKAMRVLRARGDASTMTPQLLTQIAEAFAQEADLDTEIKNGGPARLLAFDYFKRGWLGNGGAVSARLAGEGAAA